MSKRFTLLEAESLLPEIETTLREAVRLKSQYVEVEQALQTQAQHVAMQGGMVVDRQAILDKRALRDHHGERLKATVEKVQDFGCVIKDLDIGLIDFPTRFRGREVYLCWKLGEEGIAWWHGTDEGFAGRKVIDEDFRKNHEGDRVF